MDLLLVGAGGFAGANIRYLVAKWVTERYGAHFPYGTFIINVTGSFIIGLLLTYFNARANLSPNYRLVFTMGFVGAYTTFSTYTFEALTLMQDGDWSRAFLYLVSSVVVGMLAVTAGMMAGRAI